MTDAFLLKQKIEPGKTERCKELLAEQVGQTNREMSEILEVEGVYTESIFIEQAGDGEYLVWYFEAESMARVAEVWNDPAETAIEAEIEHGKSMLAEVLENPETWNEDSFELLHHLVNPERK